MGDKEMRLIHVLAAITSALVCFPAAGATAEGSEPAQYNLKIGRQPLGDALQEFAKQSGVQIIFFSRVTDGFEAPALRGRFTAAEAVAALLNDTKLTFREVDRVTIEVRPRAATQLMLDRQTPDVALAQALPTQPENGPQGTRTPQGEADQAGGDDEGHAANERAGDQELPRIEESGKAIPEMLVKGRRSMNVDIERTEDDVQPYVVFRKEEIRRSRAPDLEQFLKTRLPMNASQGLGKQGTSGNVNGANSMSSIDLRGLGTRQTLVLVNGRRMPSTALIHQGQPDINGIPLAAIERIEILPSTASGIHGGGATGGVVNIVTRQDYVGLEVSAGYDNSFDGDTGKQRFDVSGGFPLGDRTHVTIALSHSEANPLLRGERDLTEKGRARQLANNPDAFFGTATPPTGYTTNIRNASPNQNAPLQLDPEYGGTVLGSAFTFVPVGYAGIASDGAAALAGNAGQYNLDLPRDVGGALGTLLADTVEQSAMLSTRYSFSPGVEAYLDAAWFNNEAESHAANTVSTTAVTLPADAPNNPFTTPVTVRFPLPELEPFSRPTGRHESVRASGGVIVRLPADWVASADYTWSQFRRITAANSPIVGDPDGTGPGLSVTSAHQTGALDVLRDLNAFPLDYSPYLMPPDGAWGEDRVILGDIALRASGPVIEIPGGPVTVAALLERRDEKSPEVFSNSMSTTGVRSTTKSFEREQQVDSWYLETRAPVVGAGNSLPGLRELELQASVRHDRYETLRPDPPSQSAPDRSGPFVSPAFVRKEVDGTEHTLGLRFSPIEDLVLRASIGTGFLPPTLSQMLTPSQFPATVTITDPKRGNTTSALTILRTCCSNPNLRAEESESWSAGAVFKPRFAPGLRLSMDYTRIEKSGEVAFLSEQQLVDLEDITGRITRDPLTDEDIALGYTGGMITHIDRGQINISGTLVEAYDVQLDYTRSTGRFGDFHFYAVATWQRAFERQIVPGGETTDSVGFAGGPLEWRGNAGLTWERGPWLAAWNTQYFNSHRPYTSTSTPAIIESVTLNQGASRIPRQIYHDLLVGYTFDESSAVLGGLFADTELSVGIRNVFDEEPPILSTISGDGYSFYGDPRLRVYTLAIRKSF